MEITEPGTYNLTTDFGPTQDFEYGSIETCLAINSSDVVIEGNHHVIEGPNTDYTTDFTGISRGIVVDNRSGGTISNVTITNLTVKLWDVGVSFSDVNDTTLVETNVGSNSVNGIRVWYSERVNITKNSVYFNGWASSEGNGIEFFRTDNSTIYKNGGNAGDISTSNWYGIALENSDNNTIFDNNIDQTEGVEIPRRGVLVKNSNNTHLEANLLQGAAQRGLFIEGSNGTVVTGNIIQDQAMTGILVWSDAYRTAILSNTIDANGQDGGHQIILAGVNVTVRNNRITGFDRTQAGVFINGGERHRIVDNTIKDGITGIEIKASVPSAVGQVQILNNGIFDNDNYGVALSANTNASAVEIHRNTIYHNFQYGVYNANDTGIVNATGNDWGVGAGVQKPGTNLKQTAGATNITDPITGAVANGTGSNVTEGNTSGVSNVHFDPILQPQLGPIEGGEANCSNPVPITSPSTITSSGCYVITTDLLGVSQDQAIQIQASNVTLLGQNHTIEAEPGTSGASGEGIFMGDFSNSYQHITVRNVTVRGFLVGIYSGTVFNATIEDVTAVGNDEGVSLNGPIGGGPYPHATIRNTTVVGSAVLADGIVLDRFDVTLRNAYATNLSTGLLVQSLVNATVREVTMVQNDVGAQLAGQTRVELRDSRFTDNHDAGIQIFHRSAFTRTQRAVVVGNLIANNSKGIRLGVRARPSIIEVRNNRITDNVVGFSVDDLAVAGVEVHENLIAGNDQFGVESANASASLNATENDWARASGAQKPGTNRTQANSVPVVDPVTSEPADGPGDNVSEGGTDGVANVRFDPPATAQTTSGQQALHLTAFGDTSSQNINTGPGMPPGILRTDAAVTINVTVVRNSSTDYSIDLSATAAPTNVTFYLQTRAFASTMQIDDLTMFLDGQQQSFNLTQVGGSPWIGFRVPSFSTRTVTFTNANLSVADVTLNRTTVAVGHSVNVTATVANSGSSAESGNVTLIVNDSVIENRTVNVSGNSNETVSFDHRFSSPGTFEVVVNDLSGGNVTVEDRTAPSITNPTISEADGDGEVQDGDQVNISVNVSDAHSDVKTVIANASDFGGPPTLELSDGDGDGVYSGSFTVDESATTTGKHSVSIRANDTAGNTASPVDTNTLELIETTSSGGQPGFGMAIAVLVMLLTAVALRRRG